MREAGDTREGGDTAGAGGGPDARTAGAGHLQQEAPVPAGESGEPIARPGENCWRRSTATRVQTLVDAESYFDWFVRTVSRAQRSVYISAWDIHEQVRLKPQARWQGWPMALGDFLNTLARRRPELEVKILLWDFSSLYLLERETLAGLQALRFNQHSHPRIRLALDDRHPLSASHHQKVVVVDDRAASVGGLDIGPNRWDTRAHAPDDGRRKNPSGKRFAPFHDVQMAVSGPVAKDLGDLFRERWWRATTEHLHEVNDAEDPWPPGLDPQMEDVPVAVARTFPEWDGRSEVREVEQLFRDSIRSARRTIYVENQYLTSSDLGEELANRLREEDGPEVVLVTPLKLAGWLEECTLGVLRRRVLRMVREADEHDRFRVYYPRVGGGDEGLVYVHAKVMVIDDRLLRVGSANLSSRSMGLDSECDLAVEWAGRPEVAEAILAQRHDLLAEHLGRTGDEVAERVARSGSLILAIEALRGGDRTLDELEADENEFDELMDLDPVEADMERPINAEALLKALSWEEPPLKWWRAVVNISGALLVLLAIALAWKVTPLGRWLAPDSLSEWIDPLRRSPLGALAAVVGFLIGSLLVVPMTAMVAVAAMVFGPWLGVLYGAMGTLVGTAVTYWLGRTALRHSAERLAGRWLGRIRSSLTERGVLVFAAVRMIPTAPFTVVNVVAGATELPFWRFTLGTVLGSIPGMIAVAWFADTLLNVLRRPDVGNVLLAVGIGAVLVGFTWYIRKRLKG